LSKDLQNKILFQQIVELLQNARQQVLRTINQTMTITYFEIGRTIVEEEQNGKDRAEYGKQLLKGLSQELTKKFGKGFSIRNLEQIRQFYITYSKFETLLRIFKVQKTQSMIAEFKSQKTQSMTAEFKELNYQTMSSFFKLTWTHYVF